MDTILNDLKDLSASDLEKFVQAAETLIKNKNSPQKTSPQGDHPSVESLSEYFKESGIDDSIVDDAMAEIKDISDRFIKQKMAHRPTLLVIGVRYYFSKNTESNLVPVPFSDAPKVAALVNAFNHKYGTNYNSVLANRYKDRNCFLPWHKDDERMLDPNHPIGSFSDGAWRRFQVSANEKKDEAIFEYLLAARSFLVMKPGFQRHFYHQLAEGRKKFENETGRRENLTFHKVLDEFTDHPPDSQASIPIQPATQENETKEMSALDVLEDIVKNKKVLDMVEEEDEESVTEGAEVTVKDKLLDEKLSNEEKTAIERQRKSKLKKPVIEHSAKRKGNKCDTIVFGSSLVKELKPDLLAKYGQTFTVVSRSSAHISDIAEDIKVVKDTVDCKSVKNLFFVCGGNDVENLPEAHTLDGIFQDFAQLFDLAKETFPNAKVNVISLIPRRVNNLGQEHVYRMHDVNQYLSDICKKLGMRFVNVYSCFIRRNGRLNKKCFNGSLIHFSPTGNSVLGKFIIAVTYRPR